MTAAGAGDVLSLGGLVADHLRHLEARNFSASTIRNRRSNLGVFCRWCEERGVVDPREVTRPVLERYRHWLFAYRQEDGRPLSWSNQIHKLSAVKMYLRWLTQNSFVLYNPAAELEMPRKPRYLPQAVLTRAEVEQVIAVPDVDDVLGLRNRAILETFYSTGVRRMELVNLELGDVDVDLGRGVVRVRQGKGQKDRNVPIGERAVAWVDRYLLESRERLMVPPDCGRVFLNDHGGPFTGKRMTKLCHGIIAAAGVSKAGSCHIFRHTMATHMLEGGADTRYIQEMLGHEHLSTTQIYTRVSIRKLQEVHAQAHPAKLERSRDLDVSEATEESALLAQLAAEQDADDV